MSTSVTGRHRASQRPATPLNTLSLALTQHVGSLGRGGVVLAMSSGLVATMGLPAHAVTEAAGSADAAARTTPVTSFQNAFLVAPAGLTGSSPITAPSTAEVSFDHSSFTAVPKARHRDARGKGPARVPTRVRTVDGSVRGASVISLARRYLGVHYRFGGTTPSHGWDCSGSVRYIYGQLGHRLPRTSSAQYAASRRIPRSAAAPGDLVFFRGGGGIYHVGIYAGGGMMYDAGRSGRVFSKRSIFSGNVAFGRVTS